MGQALTGKWVPQVQMERRATMHRVPMLVVAVHSVVGQVPMDVARRQVLRAAAVVIIHP